METSNDNDGIKPEETLSHLSSRTAVFPDIVVLPPLTQLSGTVVQTSSTSHDITNNRDISSVIFSDEDGAQNHA